MAQLEVLYFAIYFGIRGNCGCGLLVGEEILVASCTFAVAPKSNLKQVSYISFAPTTRGLTSHVWRSLEIVDESRAARIERDVL